MNNELRIMNFRKVKITAPYSFALFALYFLLSVFSLLFFARSALAQQFSAGITPTTVTIEAKAPADIKTPITLENLSDQNITYNIFLRPFKAGPEKNGEPDYNDEISPEYKEFFTNVFLTDGKVEISEITLTPKQKRDLTLNIIIPDQAPPSDYYFTVVFLANNSSANDISSFSGARGGIGTNILLSIGPKSTPIGRVSNFYIPKFVSHGPLNISVEVANDNNYYVITQGNLVIKNMFNQIVSNIEIKPTNILARSSRLLSNSDNPQNQPMLTWNENFLLGFYKADLNVAISDKGPLVKQSAYFFAFPIEFIAGLVVLVAILVMLFKRIRKKSLEVD